VTSSQPGGALPGARFAARVEWQGWAAPAVLVGILSGAGALYWPSTASLWVEWFETPSSAYRHGPLLLVIATWLAIRAIRAARAPIAPDGRLIWVLLLAGASFAWLIAVRAGIQVGHQALLPLLIWLGIRVVLGPRIAWLVVVPIGLLYSAVPVWHAAVPALQSMTVAVVSTCLHIVAIPAYVVGDYVHIRSGVFHVEDGCAGLHYFVVAVTLAALYGELRADRWRVRAYLVAMAVAVALISNWLRVFIIIVAGYLTDMQSYLVRVDHAAFGWVLFGVAMFIFLLLARFLPLSKPPAPDSAAEGAAPTALIARATLITVLAAALGPGWSLFAPVRAASGPNVTLPPSVAGWLGPQTPCHGRWQPEYPTADRRERGEFSRDGQAVCVYVASYLSQFQGKELVGYGSSIYPPDSEVVATAVRQVAGRAVNEAQLGDEWVADRLVWYSYAVGGREMRRGVESQLAYALGTLSGAPASSVFAASTPCLPDCAAARRLLEEFWPGVGLNHERAP